MDMLSNGTVISNITDTLISKTSMDMTTEMMNMDSTDMDMDSSEMDMSMQVHV